VIFLGAKIIRLPGSQIIGFFVSLSFSVYSRRWKIWKSSFSTIKKFINFLKNGDFIVNLQNLQSQQSSIFLGPAQILITFQLFKLFLWNWSNSCFDPFKKKCCPALSNKINLKNFPYFALFYECT